MGRYPERLALVGCQPEDLEDWGGPLTLPVRDQIGPAIELARKVLAEWGVELTERPADHSHPGLLANDIDFRNYEQGGVAAAGRAPTLPREATTTGTG
jgi:hydrogenase maturation protease